MFALSSRSWTPSTSCWSAIPLEESSQLTCLIVILGFHDFSSSRMDRQMVPDGYTFGWNRGGSNLPNC